MMVARLLKMPSQPSNYICAPRGEAPKKSIPGKTAKGAVSEKSGPRSGENGFAGLLDGQLGADDTD